MRNVNKTERAGFSLLEIVVAVTIMSILAGAAVPVTSKILTYKARKATKEELALLADTVGDYVADTLQLPSGLEDLLVDPSLAGWSGPYLPGVVTDEITTLPGYLVDGWSRAYTTSTVGDVLTIRSAGEDAQAGTSADIAIAVDATPVRRAVTLARLAIVNQAILQYNAVYQGTNPLSTSWGTAFGQLVSTGFLPNSSEYQVDAWGAPFVPDPIGQAPVVKAGSVNVGS